MFSFRAVREKIEEGLRKREEKSKRLSEIEKELETQDIPRLTTKRLQEISTEWKQRI